MIIPVSVPINLPIQATNAVIITDNPLTIIDPGCKNPLTLEVLKNALKNAGFSLNAVKRVLITHGHLDHFGAAESIREISGCQIYIHEYDLQKAMRKQRKDDEYTLYYKKILTEHGCPAIGLKGTDDFLKYTASMYDPLTSASSYGETIDFDDFSLSVIHCPGHSRGSVVFYEPEKKLLISGDTVIKGITPNPIIEFLDDWSRFNSQAAFRGSIENLNRFQYQRVIPGHGEEFEDFDTVYRKYKTEWEKKDEKVIEILKRYQQLSAFEMIEHIYGVLQEFQIFLGMSETIGMLDLLESKAVIEYVLSGGIYKARLLQK